MEPNRSTRRPLVAPRALVVLVTVVAALALAPAGSAASIWSDLATPAVEAVNDGQSIEIGLRFQSQTAGSITGIRFYKGASNSTLHVGHLWTAGGAQLASVAFSGETASGWQLATLTTPVAIDANTTYVVSYSSPDPGWFAFDLNYFAGGSVSNPPLEALGGSYTYGAGGFPLNASVHNYWVDVVFEATGADATPPTVTGVTPSAGSTGVAPGTTVAAVFNEPLDAGTVDGTTFLLRAGASPPVAATVTYNAATRTALLDPTAPLAGSTTYTATLEGGAADPRVKDVAGNALEEDFTWTFTTGSAGPPPTQGPGGPILVLASAGNPFSSYYAEILRAEGLNEFAVADVGGLTAALLQDYDVVVLGDVSLSAAQVTVLGDWVTAGGNLIAMSPGPELAGLLGLSGPSSTLSDGYLLVDTGSAPGAGIVGQTIQFHGAADLFGLDGAQAVATLYSNATTATSNPAVTLRSVGSNGGQAAAFTYDLARSVVLTRQGNPAWSGQERDGIAPIRSDDLFYPDWVDLSRVAIPQADEQQRLLANLITTMNLDRKPLPRFWYFPRGEKAVVVMTGDDHGNNGTAGRFNAYAAASPAGCSVDLWECIRGTSYIYPNTPLSQAQAAAFVASGFEVALHVTSFCADWTPASLEGNYATQLAEFGTAFPALPAPVTNRTHCIAWSDYDTQPQVELAHGIRLDTNYYYWPQAWVQDRPGLFTGSGMPMRFATAAGALIDVYQATTQMTDESGQTYPATVNALLDAALGAQGYYGAFVANMHTDSDSSSGSDAIVASATSRGVPIISSKQLLDWLDGRNGSSFGSIGWSGDTLSFTVSVGVGANGLRGMVPFQSSVGALTGITRGGNPIAYDTETIKGVQYAVFPATAGSYQAVYAADQTAPVISAVVASPADDSATITWQTNEPADSLVEFGTAPGSLNQSASSPALVTSHSVVLSGLAPGTTFYYRVSSTDAANLTATSPPTSDPPGQFSTPAASIVDTTVADFTAGSLDAGGTIAQAADGEVILTPTEGSDFASAPAGWSAFAWPAETSTPLQVSGGALVVDGVRAGTDQTYAPGRSLEFVATFGAAGFQHVGFGDSYNAAPWLMFSTFNTTNTLYARTHDGSTSADTAIPGSWIGTAHRFRIEWDATEVRYSIDGVLRVTHPIGVGASLRPLASDFAGGGEALTIDWLRMSPYAASSTFTSRVLDAGQAVDWAALRWTAELPAGTGLAVSVRTGSTPSPDGSWSAFAPVGSSGADVAGTSRYLQYRIELTSTAPGATPVVESVRAEYGPATPAPNAPSLTATVPPSPANANAPRVTGTAAAGTTIALYATADCTGTALATGTAAELSGVGIAVAVADNSTTTIRATASSGAQASACSTTSVTYVEDSTPPAPPALTSTSPVSPADNNQPRVIGSAEAGSTVSLFANAACSGTPVATGSAAALASPGLQATVADNSTTAFSATARDAAGNVSACSPCADHLRRAVGRGRSVRRGAARRRDRGDAGQRRPARHERGQRHLRPRRQRHDHRPERQRRRLRRRGERHRRRRNRGRPRRRRSRQRHPERRARRGHPDRRPRHRHPQGRRRRRRHRRRRRRRLARRRRGQRHPARRERERHALRRSRQRHHGGRRRERQPRRLLRHRPTRRRTRRRRPPRRQRQRHLPERRDESELRAVDGVIPDEFPGSDAAAGGAARLAAERHGPGGPAGLQNR